MAKKKLTAIRDVRITCRQSWNCPFRGHSIITNFWQILFAYARLYKEVVLHLSDSQSRWRIFSNFWSHFFYSLSSAAWQSIPVLLDSLIFAIEFFPNVVFFIQRTVATELICYSKYIFSMFLAGFPPFLFIFTSIWSAQHPNAGQNIQTF